MNSCLLSVSVFPFVGFYESVKNVLSQLLLYNCLICLRNIRLYHETKFMQLRLENRCGETTVRALASF